MKRSHVLALVAAGLFLSCAGLVFPAVQKTRQAAARMTCAGHFCMWGTSLHTYAHSHDDKFPPGTLPNASLPPEQRLSWLVPMLANWIGMDHVLAEFDLTRGPSDPKNAKPASTHLRHFICPAAGLPNYARQEDQGKRATPLTHYVGVAGIGPDAATLPLGHPRAGVFGYDRRIPLKDGFPDGTSNTLAIIETSNTPGHWAYGGTATVRAFEPGTGPHIGPGRAFGGFHNGGSVLFGQREYGCNIGFADGSYRMLTSATDPAVLEALATVGGKEKLPPNW